ncbi:MAG TPA: hypothetical protein VJ227_00715 [Patescibacteria group bacterium]|nr:hypothetical protein [Patescibacteria group bacterium]
MEHIRQERLLFSGDVDKRIEGLRVGLGLNIRFRGTEFGANTYLVDLFGMEFFVDKMARLSLTGVDRNSIEMVVCSAVTEALASEMPSYVIFNLTKKSPIYYEEMGEMVKRGREKIAFHGLQDPLVVFFDADRRPNNGQRLLKVFAAGRKVSR